MFHVFSKFSFNNSLLNNPQTLVFTKSTVFNTALLITN